MKFAQLIPHHDHKGDVIVYAIAEDGSAWVLRSHVNSWVALPSLPTATATK